MPADRSEIARKASTAARELAQLGSAKGGHARASVLTPEERRVIARKAAAARWNKTKPPTGRDLTGFVDIGSGFLVPPEYAEAERWKQQQLRANGKERDR
jgi:hypothetical protein